MKKVLSVALLFTSMLCVYAQKSKPSKTTAAAPQEKILVIRLDDVGLCHAVNVGAEKIFSTGMPISASLMAPCPWFEEAVLILKKYPNVSVGIHLTLNAEWDHFKWGPVLGKSAVPSLVDSLGYFPSVVTWYYKDIFKLDEMEKELSAQIEKALNAGLKIDYIDGHMGACGMTPEQEALMLKLADKYKVGISHRFGETGLRGADGYAKRTGKDDFIASFDTLKNKTYLVVSHPGSDTPEMQALTLKGTDVAKARAAVPEYICSPEFADMIKRNNIKVLNYRQLIELKGLASMKR